MSDEPNTPTTLPIPDLADRLAAALKEEFDIGKPGPNFGDEPGDFDHAPQAEVALTIRTVLRREGVIP